MKVAMTLLVSVAALAVLAPRAGAAELHSVTLKVMDGGVPAAGLEVRVTYPNPETSVGTTLNLTTDDRGVVSFEIPEPMFWLTVPALNREVVGKRFDIPEKAGFRVRWEVRPRSWKRDREDQR